MWAIWWQLMKSLTAGNSNSRTITFKGKKHEKFYEEYLEKCRYQDVYHQALVYCLGIDRDTRENVNKIYNFKTGCVKTMQFYFSLTTTSLFQTSPPVAKSKELSTKLFGLCSDESIISHRMILNRYSLFCVYSILSIVTCSGFSIPAEKHHKYF